MMLSRIEKGNNQPSSMARTTASNRSMALQEMPRRGYKNNCKANNAYKHDKN